MKNSILGKARWLREVALATSKNNGARVAREWLKYAAMFVMLLTLGSGNAWGTDLTTADLDFGDPAVSYTFEALSTITNSNTTSSAKTSTSLSGFTPFTNMYLGKNNNGTQSIAIIDGSGDDDDPMTSKYFKMTTTANVSSVSFTRSFQTKGAFSFKIAKTSKVNIGLYNIAASGEAVSHTNAGVYLQFTGSAINISAGRTSGSPQKWYSVISSLPSADVLEITVIYNNTATGTSYGDDISLAANNAHIFINGTAIMDGSVPKGFYINGNGIGHFRLAYAAAGTSKVDDIKIYDALPDAATPASCSNYSFHYGATRGTKSITDQTVECFSRVGSTDEYQVTGFTIPATSQSYFVGYTNYWYDDGMGTGSCSPKKPGSSLNYFYYLPITHLQAGCDGKTGAGLPHAYEGAYGTIRIYQNSCDANLYAGFKPQGYQMRVGSGDDWENVELTVDPSDETVWTSAVMDVDATMKEKKYYVNIWTGSAYSSSDDGVSINNWTNGDNKITSMRHKTNSGDNWADGVAAGSRGFFRTWVNNCANNGYMHFVPTHRVVFYANWPTGAGTDQYSVDVSVEESNASIALASDPTAPTGYTFDGWYDAASGGTKITTARSISAGATADIELYAHWNETLHDVTVEYKCGSTSLQDNTTIEGVGIATTGTTTAPASFTGYTWSTWSAMPSGVTTSTTPLTTRAIVINATADGKTITANYTANQYNITYKDQGNVSYSGAVTAGVPTGAPTTHTYGSATALVNGSKDGYTFNGWFTDEDCTEGPVTSLGATAYTADITLYAKWTERVAITFNVPTGVTKPSNSYTDVALPTPSGFPSAVDVDCWAFAGWTESSSVNSTSAPATLYPAGSIYNGSQASAFNLYAVYSRNKYLVVYDNDMLEADADYVISTWKSDNYAVVGIADGVNAEVADMDDNFHDKVLKGLHYYTLDNPTETAVWHLTGTTDSYVLQNKATGKYLDLSSTSSPMISGSSATLSITEGTGDDAQTYKVTGGDNHLVISSSGASVATGDATYYFLYKLISSKYMTTPTEPTYTVTWKVAGESDQTTPVNACEGLTAAQISALTVPSDDHLDVKNGGCITNGKGKFMGWSTQELGSESGQSNPGDLFKTYDNAPYLTGDITLYAVFADGDMTENEYKINNSGTINSNWEKTNDRSQSTASYAEVSYVWQMYGAKNSNPEGKINTTSTYANISGFSINVATGDNASTVTLYYSDDSKESWTEVSSRSISKNQSGYTDYDFDVSSIPSSAVYLMIKNSTNSLYVNTITITTGTLSNYRTTCCSNKIAAPSVTDTKTAYTITLTWPAVTSVYGNASSYEMQWNGGDWATVTSPVEKSSLTPNTSYSWKVRVKTWTGEYYCAANEASGSTTTNQVYTVTYNANGGTVTTLPSGGTYEEDDEVTVAAKPSTTTKSGYTFTGWNTANDGSGEHYNADGSTTFDMPAENVVLYAEWTIKKNYFIDRMHGKWDGEHTEPTTGYNCYVREGAGYTVPDLSDDATGSNSCVTGHAHFVGWVASGNIDTQGGLKSGYTIIKGGTSGTASVDGTIYYAVWAEE